MRKLTEQDIAAIIGTKNAGYTVTQARVKGGDFIDSDHYGVALAVCEAKTMIVTWIWHLEADENGTESARPTFYWGHYFDSIKEEAAQEDYYTRQ